MSGAAATQVDHPRPDHPGHRRPVRAAAHRPSGAGCWSSWCSPRSPSACSASSSASGRTASRSCRSMPLLIITPLTFLGGSFYSISMLPPVWQTVTLFNPVVYLVSGFRWSFFEHRRRERGREPRHDGRVPGRLPGGRVVDLQDGVPAEELNQRKARTTGGHKGRAVPCEFPTIPYLYRHLRERLRFRRDRR